MNALNSVGRVSAMVAAALVLTTAACGSESVDKAGGPVPKPIVLTLLDGESDTTNALPFASAVNALSHGALRIKIEGNWRGSNPNYETALIQDVQAGRAQLGITGTRAFDTLGINNFEALQAPFLIDSIALERTVLASPIPRQMLKGLTPHGLVGLAVLPGPLRRPLGFAKPLVAASDFQGVRIGIRASGVTEMIFQALGATAVVLKRSDDVSGLTGIESHISTIDSSFPVQGATLTGNVVFEPRPNVIFMSGRAFASLSAAQQRVLVAAARAQTTGDVYEADSGSLRDMCRRGLKVVAASPADLASLSTAVQPVYRRLETNPATKSFISEITAMRQAARGSTDAVSCSSADTAASSGSTPTSLDGTWTVAFTQSQLQAAGPSSNCGANNPANYGHFSLTFSRGHWSETGSPGTNGDASGTYVVAGDKVTFYRHDQAYQGSDGEIWGPYIWSVYRDTLTFKNTFIGGPCLNVKAWHKVGA
jgi:TRAP-type transport system periplasmic protein